MKWWDRRGRRRPSRDHVIVVIETTVHWCEIINSSFHQCAQAAGYSSTRPPLEAWRRGIMNSLIEVVEVMIEAACTGGPNWTWRVFFLFWQKSSYLKPCLSSKNSQLKPLQNNKGQKNLGYSRKKAVFFLIKGLLFSQVPQIFFALLILKWLYNCSASWNGDISP